MGADAFAEELDPEGVEGSDTETADEWLLLRQWFPPRLCESRILDASESSCERRRVASRSLAHPQLQHLGCPTLLQWSSLENQALTRGLCCREPAGTVGPSRSRRYLWTHGVRRRRTPPPPQLLEVSQTQSRAILGLRRSHRAFRWKKSSKRPGLSRASRPSTPKAARRFPTNVSRELVVDHLEELSGRLSQLETTEKGAFASPSAQLGFSQKARELCCWEPQCAERAGSVSYLSQWSCSLRTCASAAWDRMHDQVPATLSDHRPRRPPQTSQPHPENETASLGGAFLCVASALDQKHDSGGTVHDAFGQNPGVANSQECDAIFGDQSSRESSGPARLGGQALTASVVRTRKGRPEVVVASRESRVRRDLSVLDGEAWSWRRHADVCLLPRCGDFRSLKRFVVVTAAALEEGRSGNLQRQNALLHHMYAVLESASQDPSHETEWGWPILGIQDPEGRLLPSEPQSRVPWWPATRSASPWMQRARALGDSASTASETSPSVAAHFEKEIQAEFDRRNAKGDKGKGGTKGAQGEE